MLTGTRCRSLVIASAGLLACATEPTPAATPLALETATPPDATPPGPGLEARLLAFAEQADAALGPEDLAAAAAAGLTTPSLIDAVRPWLADPERPLDATAHAAVRLLAALDEADGLEAVAVFALRGDDLAEDALTRALEARAAAAVATRPCTPPTAETLAAVHASLDDFRVLDRTATGGLRARAPTPSERDDLAYFLAAVGEAGPVIGAGWEDPSPAKPGIDAALRRAASEWTLALDRGDLGGARTAGFRYLELLGWPEPIHVLDEIEFAWGGAAYSYRMRDLAEIEEVLASHAHARSLWARANPGGGACGTTVSYRWQDQVRGSIRSAELDRGCQATVAERLLDVDASDTWSFGWQPADDPADEPGDEGFDYGPGRLAAAGFDLARLYRGALLTRNRDAAPTQLTSRLGGPERGVVQSRLDERGREAWEARVLALEGLLDQVGEPALAEVVALLPVLDPPARARAIAAIGRAARRDAHGPCDPDAQSWGAIGGSHWYRVVRPFGRDCATRLDDAATTAWAEQLELYLRDPDAEVQAATADALVDMLATGSVATLRARAKIEAERDPDDERAWVADHLRDAAETLSASLMDAAG